MMHRLQARIRRARSGPRAERLGDFTASPRLIVITLIAIGIGAISAVVALVLLRLIGLFTNLFYYQRWSTNLVSPAGNHLGVFAVLVPVVGGLIVGLMARYGSERIRGHGIPEAIEAILINGSRMQPKVAILKPLGSAIAIGSGGPFGAEGPIIMTGGAFGSLVAQFLHLTNAERKTLLVAGAAGGMAAVFAAPVAATLLGVELLLFEWKPRSLIPVALSAATAGWLRGYLIGVGPVFPTPPHPALLSPVSLAGCVIVGIAVGVAATVLTMGVYGSEDGYRKLPIHWMWWPALGGLVIGIGGLIFPPALGVGYDVIGSLLAGQATIGILLGIVLVKSTIWAVGLASGTSGGVLAPLLMIGGAVGGLVGLILPNQGPGFWPLVGMAAVMGGAMRAPFTGVVFAIELTHDMNAFLPLLIAAVVADGVSVLVMHRSILTEKVARRGYHLSSEYSVDPLEVLFVREAMRTQVVTIDGATPVDQVLETFNGDRRIHRQALYPVLGKDGALTGVMTLGGIHTLGADEHRNGTLVSQVAEARPVVAYPDETLRSVVYRMASNGLTRLPVVERGQPRRVVGLISLRDLLVARSRNLDDERRRERVIKLQTLVPGRFRRARVVESTRP